MIVIAVYIGMLIKAIKGYQVKNKPYPVRWIGSVKAKWHAQRMTAIPTVTRMMMKMNDPISLGPSSFSAPDK